MVTITILIHILEKAEKQDARKEALCKTKNIEGF